MIPQWKLASLLKAKKHFSSGSWWILEPLNMVYILCVLKKIKSAKSLLILMIYLLHSTPNRELRLQLYLCRSVKESKTTCVHRKCARGQQGKVTEQYNWVCGIVSTSKLRMLAANNERGSLKWLMLTLTVQGDAIRPFPTSFGRLWRGDGIAWAIWMIRERKFGRWYGVAFQEYGTIWKRRVWNGWVMETLSQLAWTELGLIPKEDFKFNSKQNNDFLKHY